VSKKFILLTAAMGLVSFGGSFGFGWLRQGWLREAAQAAEEAGAQQAPVEMLQPMAAGRESEEEVKREMTKTQLKSLVAEVRDKVTEYEERIKGLESQEQRLQMTHDMVKKDIEKLNDLRVELTATVASLKSEREKLEQTLVQIGEVEKANLATLAATYDKMEADSAGKILTNLTKMSGGSGSEDAVKILHYMTERTRGELLAGLAISEPDLAALFCQRLKRVVEE